MHFFAYVLLSAMQASIRELINNHKKFLEVSRMPGFTLDYFSCLDILLMNFISSSTILIAGAKVRSILTG